MPFKFLAVLYLWLCILLLFLQMSKSFLTATKFMTSGVACDNESHGLIIHVMETSLAFKFTPAKQMPPWGKIRRCQSSLYFDTSKEIFDTRPLLPTHFNSQLKSG